MLRVATSNSVGLLSLALLSFCVVGSGSASAALIVPTSPSDTIVSSDTDDQVFGPFNLGFNFSFFGSAPVTQVRMSSNGNLQFATADATFADVGFPTMPPMIAPFWDDLSLPPGNLRVNSTVANQFTAIWNGVNTFGDGNAGTMEAVLLGAGNAFGRAANSIILSYGDVNGTSDGNVTAGLNNGINFAVVPGGSANGVFTTAQAVALSNRAWLFTPAGNGYTVSLFSGTPTVPEPGSIGLLLAGVGVFWMARRKLASR